MRHAFIAALIAATSEVASALFWFDGYGYRVFKDDANMEEITVSVCSTDPEVDCQNFQSTPREDVKAINADAFFIQDDHGEEYWYAGPGDGIWMLSPQSQGYTWIEPLSPIPRNVTQNGSMHNILSGHATFMAETQEVVASSSYNTAYVAITAFALGASTVYLATRGKRDEDHFIKV